MQQLKHAKEFVSAVEKIMSAEELFFKPTPAFGKYRRFLEHAVAHPAKMNTELLEFLVKRFTRLGDTVLDPMAGSGSTGVVCALHGRNCVQVEVEPQFYCFDAETEILTKNGWKKYNEITYEDEICTLGKRNKIEYQKPSAIFIYDYKGKMYKLQTPFIDILVTPNHRLYVTRGSRANKRVKYRKFRLIEAKDIFGHFARFKKDGIWKGDATKTALKYFTLPAVEYGGSWRGRKGQEKKIPLNEWLKFFGFYLAEGSATYRLDCKGYSNYIVSISNTNKEYLQELIELCKKWGYNPFPTGKGFQIYDKQLYTYLAKFGKSHERYIPVEIKNLPPRFLKILYEYMMRGDGSVSKYGEYYLTTSKKLADDVQEILLKIGSAGNIYVKNPSSGKRKQYEVSKISNHLYPTINHHRNNWKYEEWVDYEGKVWCVSVPNQIVYVRRNGKTLWCGNSWMERARENVEKHQMLTQKGWIKNICGDARELSRLLSDEVSHIITSPPYGETCLDGGDPERRLARLLESGYDPKDFLGGRARNAVLKHYDAVITSPPYLKTAHKGAGINRRRPRDVKIGCYTIGRTVTSPDAIDNLPKYGNITHVLFGEEDKQTYLSEMLKVYSEMWKVLKPNGLAIIVVKPFIKNKRIVDLPLHSHILLSFCGFSLEKVYKLRLKTQSFWRILLYRKYPDIERINHEYVLIYRKP
ncbi:MAG: DNA methyltransferase [Thermoproteota archaeon]